MQFLNATRMIAGYTMGIEPSGRELLVVVIKGTFRLPADGEAVRLHEEQLPLVLADTFTGEPGFSAPQYEADFAPRKARCDVVLLGSAHAPGRRPAARVPVGLRVGGLRKAFAVVGDRRWSAGLAGISAGPPEPFDVKPISYDVAFGGVDTEHEDPAQHGACLRNPVGRGYRRQLRSDWVEGRPLPNTEELDRPVERPDGDYAPMAFGPIGRNWVPRSGYAGTYDQDWIDNVCPFLPRDFDERYYLCAPHDQQLAHPVGGIEVALVNLTPEGERRFTLPAFEAPVHVFPKGGGREDLVGALDTLVLEPDLGRFTMTWRACRPLKRDLFEIAQVLVGRKGNQWWQQREEVPFPIPVMMVPAGEPAEDEE